MPLRTASFVHEHVGLSSAWLCFFPKPNALFPDVIARVNHPPRRLSSSAAYAYPFVAFAQYIGLWPWTTIHGVFARFAFAAAKSASSQSYILFTYAASKYSPQKNTSEFHATKCTGPMSSE